MTVNRGFVLMTVVPILTVMTLLVLVNMKWVMRYHKRQHQWHAYQNRMALLDQAAETLAGQLEARGTQCMTPIQSDVQLFHHLLHRGCKFANNYQYLITDLGAYVCLKIKGSEDESSTRHWLLSVLDPHLGRRFVQLRVAMPIPNQPCLWPKETVVQKGILTWRYVSYTLNGI